MKAVIYLLAAASILEAQGSMLKCGEDIIVQRGEKKTLRFWSTDDELMKVEMIPIREQSDASALLAIFKDSYSKGPNLFGSREAILTTKDSLEGPNVDESLYRIDNQLIEKFNDHLLSRTEVSESKNKTIPSDYEYEEDISDQSNFTDTEDHEITQGEDYYTDGQEKIIDEGNLRDHQDYDEAENVEINSHDAAEDEELKEETKSPDLGSENNFKEEETFKDISTTDSFSLIDETDVPKEQETTLETLTTQVTGDFAFESTTEDSNIFVTMFDSDFKEDIVKDVNNFNQARTDYETTAENMRDVTTEPENQESSTQYPSQQNTEAEFTNDESTRTNIPLETGHYELRHEAIDSSAATDIPDVNVITEFDPFTTHLNFQTSTQSDFYSEESDITTERESSTTINSKNLYTEKIEDTTTRYDEQNQNLNLFKSDPIEIDESTTEIIESTTSIPQSLAEVESTEPEILSSTEGSSTTDQTEMDIDVNNELFLTTESIFDRKDNDIVETNLSDKVDEMTEAPVSKEELNNIISQLKSQEALLFSSGKEGSVGSGSFPEDSESVDIKLNILKNIIKGITSEIASNDKSSFETEINNNMEQTHLIYPDGLEYDDGSSLTSRDELDAEQKNDEISKGKIHIENNFASEGSNFVKIPIINIEPASVVENNEIILPSIYRTDLSDSHIEDTAEGLATTENQLVTEDEEITTANSLITSSLENETDLGPKTIIESNENVNKEDVNGQRETILKVAPEDAAPKVEKSPFEELYLPLDFFGVFNSKTNKGDKVVDEHVDLAETTTQRIEVIETTEVAEFNNEENIYDEADKITQDFQNNIKNMRKDEVSLIDSTTVHNMEDPETSTRAVSSLTEISKVTGSTNDDSIFSKESGSENIVALLRNSLLNTDNDEEEHEKPQQENNIFIPGNLFNSKVEQTPQFYSEQKSDNQVLINEQGSKVVIIKPNSDILKAKKEHDSPSLAFNTETGHYEVEIESTTSAEPELSDEVDSDLEILNDENTNYFLKSIEQDMTTMPDFQRTGETSERGRTSEAPEMNTETYVPFGIVKEIKPAMSAISDNFPSQHALTDASSDHEHDELDEQESHLDETEVQESESNNTNINNGNHENSEYDNIYDYSTRNKETENSYDSYPEYESDIFEPEHQQEFSVPDSEKLERKINSKISHVETPEEYLANHRISEPLPYLLQTRKGFVDADAPFIRAGSVQHRRDDSHQTFGEDSPFYIKLPGTQNAVPVFLQYEPIKVNYVHADKFFKKKQFVKDDMKEDEMDNDLDSKFYKESLKDKTMKDKPPMTLEEIVNSQSKIDLHLRPDPFYVMDPPDLGENVNINDDINEVDSLSIDVESKLGVQKGHIPSVIRGDKPVYPGEYFIKNPDNSYSSSDTSALTNQVFTLGSKVTLPPREPGNLQYTPFPLTTNPPKVNLPEASGNVIEGSTIPQNLSSSLPLTSNDTDTKVYNPTENPPSIEYSPIPSIDYPDSYGAFKYTNISYNESNDTRLYEDSTNEFSSAYPEKAFITDVKNDKLVDGPLKKNSDFDIVALANFLHQNQKVWSNPKATPIPDGGSWRSPSWDDVIHSSEQTRDFRDSLQVASPWVAADESLSEERYYSAFHSPEEVPGIDPAFFSYRKMPKNIKDLPPASDATSPRKKRALDSQIDGIVRYIETLPIPMQNALLYPTTKKSFRIHKRSASAGEHVYCEWNIKTEPGLYLLVTFHNLSAPYTVDCYGAYIEVERENNGYDARWCGNRAAIAGSRPHVIFAKSEVRITVYDNGDAAKTFPTGFEADIEVIDLFDSEEYKTFMEKKATPKIRRLMEG